MLQFEHLSYWEQKEYIKDVDFCIVGSGIVGLTSAIHLKKLAPKAKILIVERGYLPSGASTKNAGFVCYGSPSEILDDLNHTSLEKVSQIISMRYKGFQLLSELIDLQMVEYHQNGSYELFEQKSKSYSQCIDQINDLNELFYTVTSQKEAFKAYNLNTFQHKFDGFEHAISCELEGEIDTGKMMLALIHKANDLGVRIMNNIHVQNIGKDSLTTQFGEINFKSCIVATNAFTNSLIQNRKVDAARAQVLITSEIPDLKLKGTYHFGEGYYYFRVIDQRVMFGGGRNTNFEAESTNKMITTEAITIHLTQILKDKILPNTNFTIDHCWSGIMGLGTNKLPYMEFLSDRVFLAAKLGGMGVAMGTYVGKNAAYRLLNK